MDIAKKLYGSIWAAKDPALAKDILLTKKLDIQQPYSNDGRQFIHYAAQFGLTEVIQILIDQGADANAVTNNGYTPLHYLAGSDEINIDAVKVLLEHGANIKLINNKGKTPAQIAKANLSEYLSPGDYQEREIIIKILKSGKLSTTVSLAKQLLYSAQIGDARKFTELCNDKELEKKAFDFCVAACDKSDLPEERLSIVKLCISHIPNLNEIDKKSKRPLLSLCVSNNLSKIASLLIGKGADIDQTYKKEPTALGLALTHQYTEMVALLLKHGAKISGEIGVEYLHTAIQKKNKTGVMLLIAEGVDINEIQNKTTPLQLAVELSQTEIVKILLNAGANPNLHTKGKDYPLVSAIRNGSEVMVHALLLHGADPKLLMDGKSSIQDFVATSKQPTIIDLFKLNKQQLKEYKPNNKEFRFTNARLLFAEGESTWGSIVSDQVKKVFGKMALDIVKSEAGEIEYFDVVDNTGEGIYQLVLFNFGDGCLFNFNKTTVVANIVQSGFDITKKMPASAEKELRLLMDGAYQDFDGKIRQSVNFLK